MLWPQGILLFVVCVTVGYLDGVDANAVERHCACGYYDTTSRTVFTESMLVYFNETISLPIPGLAADSYEHKYEKGWNTHYREGADPSLVGFSSLTNVSTSLELHVSPSQRDHLVIGSSVRTQRRDIQYGAFTSSLRSPAQWAGDGGSALSMALHYNLSQQITMNLQNANDPSNASVGMLIDEEYPSSGTGIPYSSMVSGAFGKGTVSPWDFTEFRIDWTKTMVEFRIGGHIARSAIKPNGEGLLGVPASLYLRHWSNGDIYSSQGPPQQMTVANARWIRGFFNSSLMTQEAHTAFDDRCQVRDACRSDDMTLRGSSSWSEEATIEWKQKAIRKPKRTIAVWLAISCLSLTTLLLIPPLLKRSREISFPIRKPAISSQNIAQVRPASEVQTAGYSIPEPPEGPCSSMSRQSESHSVIQWTPVEDNNSALRPAVLYRRKSHCSTRRSVNPEHVVLTKAHSLSAHAGHDAFRCRTLAFQPRPDTVEDTVQDRRLSEDPQPSRHASVVPSDREAFVSSPMHNQSEDTRNTSDDKASPANAASEEIGIQDDIGSKSWESSSPWGCTSLTETVNSKLGSPTFSMASTFAPAHLDLSGAERRTRHLAGLVTISCLSVTVIHFSLTFIIGDFNPGAPTRSQGKVMGRKTINQFLLNMVLIGPFLVTSARFLVMDFLRTGDLVHIARKTVGRTFRLMVPITFMILLEYFLIDCGATKWLEYLPSITWSSWPFTVGYTNFANFLSEILELAFLIPNAVPIVIFNFCTDVLWTVPIQLQGSWLSLLGIVVIREIKTPWKRFGFYAFCIVNHWYALSWGSYSYLGILLTDLDLTYKWRSFLHARPIVYYPLLILLMSLAIGGLAFDIIAQLTGDDYALHAYGLHPDLATGLPISQTGRNLEPQYFIPRFNGILFTIGIQAAVELSPCIQRILSCKLLMLIFPHIFTLYLVHGFVFWTLGSWLCITLSVRGLSYWLNIFIVAICSYGILLLCVPPLTPVIEWLGKSMTADIWEFAHDEPAPRKPTLYPFPKVLFLGRTTPLDGGHT